MNNIIGQSPDITHLLRTLPMIALSDASVLLSGETGTGKELIAEALHQESRRNEKSFVIINCAALPNDDELEADLFGRCDESGKIIHYGRLLEAEGGTVFLDDVDALPLSVQAKILRFIEAGECRLQGRHKIQYADVRVLAATSKDLNAAVKAGSFRADLYYRLNVVPLTLPPLRERNEDIGLLLRQFNREFAGKNAVVRYSKEAEHALQVYAWPGNVRELANFCQRMALLNAGKLIQVDDLPRDMLSDIAATKHVFTLPPSGVDLAKVELDLIEQALEQAAGNRSKAARLLGISRDTLLYRMQKYNMTP